MINKVTDATSAKQTIEETFPISGLDCPDCALKVEKAVRNMVGVKDVSVNFTASNLHLEYDPSINSHTSIFKLIEGFGYKVGVAEETRTTVFRIEGLDCPDCSAKLQRKLAGKDGVDSAQLSFETGKLTIEYNEELLSVTDIIKTIRSSGYAAELEGSARIAPVRTSFWASNARARSVMASAISLTLAGIFQLFFGLAYISIALYVATILIAGYRPARNAVSSVKSFVFDMNFLMTVAVIGAVILGQWAEGATVMFLYAFGSMLEAFTMDKTRHAIHGLLELAPNQAVVKIGDETKVIPVESLHIGDIVIVKPGERIPVDGKVVAGSSSVNQSAITGESLPIPKGTGDMVFAGTLNHDGYIEIETTKHYKDTTISNIIHLVEDAQSKKAPSEQFINRFSSYYSPSVIALAVAIATIPPLFGQPFVEWFYRALVLLVISCPCALVISTPVSIAAAIGAASKNGVLIKGGSHLEMASQISSIVFDKTGTLTSGRLAVTDVVPLNGFSEDDITRITGALELKSEHPVAQAVVNYTRARGIGFPQTEHFQSLPGRGVKAEIDGVTYYAGNQRLFSENELMEPEVDSLIYAMQRDGKTVFILGTEDKLLGLVAVADSLRRDTKATIQELKQLGIANIIMLTGDNADTAEEISRQIGIDDYRAELLPGDKVHEIENISMRYGRVAMIGDGVNDAPAISRADVGIAMGAAGSDIALETSDIALMGDELANIPYTIKLSRRALKIIKQNVAVSILVKIGFIGLALLGLSTLWMAVFADTGISILVILNGMRLFSRSRQG